MKPSTFDKLKAISIVLGIVEKWLIHLGSAYEDAILELIIVWDAPHLFSNHTTTSHTPCRNNNIAYKRILGGPSMTIVGFIWIPTLSFGIIKMLLLNFVIIYT